MDIYERAALEIACDDEGAEFPFPRLPEIMLDEDGAPFYEADCAVCLRYEDDDCPNDCPSLPTIRALLAGEVL